MRALNPGRRVWAMDRPRCTYCGEVIGVYEPARVILEDGSDLPGSLLSLRLDLQTPGSVVVHDRCYGERVVDREPD
jgi:hypothetical protein